MVKRESKLDVSELVKQLMTDIQKGTIGDDDAKLPSEPVLMSKYQVTRYTLRQALTQLGNLGYTYQAHGIGTFVRPNKIQDSIAMQHNGGLSEEIARQGHVLKTVQASQKIVTLADATFYPESAGLTAETELIEVNRRRTINGAPYLVEQSYYLKDLIESIPDTQLYASLFDYLAEQGIKVGFIDKVINAEQLPAEPADFFKLEVGQPTLVVRDDTYLSTGNLLAFSKIYYDYRLAKMFMFKKISQA